MSWKVGLGHSEDDLEIQGEIDFEFFEDEASSSIRFPRSSNHSIKPTATLKVAAVKIPFGSGSCSNDDVTTDVQPNSSGSNNDDDDCGGATSSKYNYSETKTTNDESKKGYVNKKVIKTIIPNLEEANVSQTINKLDSYSQNGVSNVDPNIVDEVKGEGSSGGGSLSSSISVSDSDGMSSLSEDSYEGLSDSESITDVTPLTCNSPYFIDSPRPQSRLAEKPKRMESNLKPLTPKEMDYCESEQSTSFSSSSKKKDSVRFLDASFEQDSNEHESGSVDLNVLVAAIKRLEVEQNYSEGGGAMARNSSKLSMPPQLPVTSGKGRKNMSFSNDEVRRIDQENQRLLKRIVSTQHTRQKPKGSQSQKGPYSHVPSSQVFRHRKQRQIELENVALLRRIESAKPSRELSRAHLLRDFNRIGCSPGKLSSIRSSSASSRPSSSVASFPSSIMRHSVRSYSLGSLPKLSRNCPSPSPLTLEEPKPNRLEQQRNST